MKTKNNPELLQFFMDKYHILEFFSTGNMHFQLFYYQKGDLIVTPLEKTSYLQFVVDGTISIYALHPDGQQYTLSSGDGFTIFGDMEFVKPAVSPFFVEAMSNVYTIALSLEEYATKLKTDIPFLHLLLRSLAKKIDLASHEQVHSASLEKKLIYYLHHSCPGQMLTHVGKTAEALHVSRRQLQRVLKELTDNGVLKKIGKGHYQLEMSEIGIMSR